MTPSAATTAWVEAQNKVTNEYLSQIPFRENLLKRLTTLADYEKISAPIKKHGKYYFSKNDFTCKTRECILRTGFTGRRVFAFSRPEQSFRTMAQWHWTGLYFKRRQIYRLQYLAAADRIGLKYLSWTLKVASYWKTTSNGPNLPVPPGRETASTTAPTMLPPKEKNSPT